jgi:O-antigen biosynthesis protein WbqP
MLKRCVDLILAVILIFAFMPIIAIVALAVSLTSKGPIIYWSIRIGKNGKRFLMPKFRTMIENSPVVATHLLPQTSKYLTGIGSFLRKTSLDELPQLWSILLGDMTFVGPRPALFNQEDLISLRAHYQVDKLLPGLTGWAQVNGRDDLSILEKVQYEVEYLNAQSFWFDLKILCITFLKVIGRDGVSH